MEQRLQKPEQSVEGGLLTPTMMIIMQDFQTHGLARQVGNQHTFSH